jgi:hypothetical protein
MVDLQGNCIAPLRAAAKKLVYANIIEWSAQKKMMLPARWTTCTRDEQYESFCRRVLQ